MKLFMDSSTKYLCLAIVTNEDKVFSFSRLGKNDHSEMLISSLECFLAELKLKVDDLTEIYIGRGPGSYTGLRISGTCGKTLSFIKNLPLYSFSSLDFLLSGYLEKDGLYLAHIDAKKNHSYVKVIKVINGQITVVQPEIFAGNEIFDNYPNAVLIEADDTPKNVLNILKNKLVIEEDNLEYNPNYLRSEFN